PGRDHPAGRQRRRGQTEISAGLEGAKAVLAHRPAAEMTRQRLLAIFLGAVAVIGVEGSVLSERLGGGQATQTRVEGWPQWRGPNRDGAATFSVPAQWPERLNQKWKVEVGIGYAAPLVAGDRVYTFSRQNEDEVMRALDAATGKTIWETKYNATFKANPA